MRMNWTFGQVLALAFLTWVGCQRGEPKTQTTPSPASEPTAAATLPGGAAMAMCPTRLPGTTVRAEATESGVVMVFATTSAQVDELRQRVRGMVSMHTEHGRGAMHGRMHAGMRGGMPLVPSTATVEDTADGARIVLVPEDPAQLPQLRQGVEEHVARMARGECPMMSQPGGAQTPAPARCPMIVPGTTVRAQDVEGGAALVFTTTSGQLPELRQHVRDMAERHNRHHREAQARGGKVEHGSMRGLAPGAPTAPEDTSRFALELVLSQATIVDVQDGARLVLVPHERDDVDALRANVHRHAEQMAASGECPAMARDRE